MNIFPTFNGVFCVSKKKSILGYVNEKAFHIQQAYSNSFLPIEHNNLLFLRGIEYLILGTFLFFKGLVLSFSNDKGSFKTSKAVSEKLNVSFVGVFGFICFIVSLIIAFLLFGLLPSYFSVWFIAINKSLFLRNFVLALLKVFIFLIIIIILRYSNSFNKIFTFNYACNQVANGNNFGYRAKNFLNFSLNGFILSLFMITFLSIEMSPYLKFLYNIFIFLIVFSVLYEIYNLVDKSKYKTLKKICSWLCVTGENQTALLVARSAYWECKMIESTQEGKQLSVVLAYVQNKLSASGIDSSMEAEWLVAGTLKKNLNELYFTSNISTPEEQNIKKVLERRLKGEPLDKIFGEKEFYGLVFKVNTSVLSPRFETELLVEQVLLEAKQKKLEILDLCTGSGAIAVSIKKNSNSKVFASDISESALKVAKENAKINGVNIKFVKSDMFNGLKSNQKYDIIVSNPPYIPKNVISTLDKEVKNYDPKIALDGGEDGLDFYKIIAQNSHEFLKPNGLLFLEIGINQAKDVVKLLKKNFTQIKVIKDYNNIERIIISRKKDNVRKN